MKETTHSSTKGKPVQKGNGDAPAERQSRFFQIRMSRLLKLQLRRLEGQTQKERKGVAFNAYARNILTSCMEALGNYQPKPCVKQNCLIPVQSTRRCRGAGCMHSSWPTLPFLSLGTSPFTFDQFLSIDMASNSSSNSLRHEERF
jgi:hypothetical protein